jgi:5-(carboxyamino)imidazole ribonucleotide synthase
MAELGILGGGQLGRMLLAAATALGLDVAIMEPAPDSPAGRLTRQEIVGAWDDEAALHRLAGCATTITLENEFVPARSLRLLEQCGCTVVPSASALAIVQDKLHQKEQLAAAGLPVPPFRAVVDAADVLACARELGWPLLLKRRRNGYDGYGNRTLHGSDDVAPAMAALQGPVDRPAEERALMVEAYVGFARELAVMVARGCDGQVRLYPVVETVQRNHVCHQVYAPAAIARDVAAQAAVIARAAVEALGLHGVAGVELFLAADGAITINELAPRVHNSGHYSIEACVTSQFENAVRAALGVPLGDTALVAPAAAMVNLLGARDAPARPVGLAAALAVPGAHVHLYGKRRSRPGRKMGHVTALGATVDEAARLATAAASCITI